MKKSLTLIVISLIILSNVFIPINASNNTDPDHDGIPGVRGVNYDVVTVFVENNNFENRFNKIEITPNALLGYSVGNVQYVGICGPYSSPPGGEAIGVPGVTLTLSTSVTLSASVSTSFGIGVNDVSAAVGVQIQASYTLQISGSFTVPSKYNGRTVKSVKFSGHPYSKLYSYDFLYLGLKTGSGAAEIPWGISYNYIYFY